MAKSKAGTVNLFAGMQKAIERDELTPRKRTIDKENEDLSAGNIVSENEGGMEELKEEEPDRQPHAREEKKEELKPVVKEVKKPPKKEKIKMGRPLVKEGEYVRLAIDIPAEMAEQVNTAKVAYKNSLRLYVTKLIRKDLSENMNKYEEIAEMAYDMMNK